MKTEIQPYGAALRSVMQERGLSMSALQERLHLPSRTTVTRIVKDACKYSTMLEFHNNLYRTRAELPFTKADYQRLEEALEVSRYGWHRYLAVKRMDYLFTGDKSYYRADNSRCANSSGAADNDGKSLTEVLQSVLSWPDIRVVVVNAMFDFVTQALQTMLRAAAARPNCRVVVEHYVLTEKNDDKNLYNFTALYPLLSEPNYTCYVSTKSIATYTTGNYMDEFYATENYIMLLKSNGIGFSSDRINLYSRTDFSGIFNTTGMTLYQYEMMHFRKLRQHYSPFAASITERSDPKDLLTLCALFEETERAWQSILIKPDLCISQIEPEILTDMLKDAQYLGLAPDDPAVQTLIDLQVKRYSYFTSPRHHNITIISRQGLNRLVETGRWTDQPAALRALRRDELKRTLKQLVHLAETISGFCIYLMRDELNLSDCYFKVCGENALWAGRQGPGENTLRLIQRADIVRLFRDYVVGELVPNLTYSGAETLEYLKRVIAGL